MIRKMFHRLRADERGSAGIIYALAAIPVLMLAGGTVDYTIALNERARLQGALDAAALAAMRRRDLEADEIDSLVRDYVMSHFAGNGRTTLNRSDISVSVEKISGYWQVSATARATVRTPFWGILGRTSASVKARADVKDSVSALDVVLVL
ncbi:MAG TPA: hypothetical protein ENK13_01250, partial [Thermopetrobacter sp.]|nr:hypothetical protein [Thermopetrobacter sp.]